MDGGLDDRAAPQPGTGGRWIGRRGDARAGCPRPELDSHTVRTPTPDADAGPTRSWAGWARTHPGMVAALALPLLVFGIPQLFGMTYLSGDNFLQNFPMRVLVGTDLIHGALPLWNPYLFSGTPLLGGFNAGAAYPVTWLTAVLPIFTAWTLTLAITYDVALAGMYLFLRRQGIASTAATFGAVTFALGRVHDRPAGPHRPDRGGGMASLDPGGRPRPHRAGDRLRRRRGIAVGPGGPVRGPVRPAGGPEDGSWC